ncbi:MAG TPA: glycerol-3-phosphate 1-O-acyltransferase PlsY [Candidatus Acidoferrales bacterium]|nr:glycerol-3-phosphate 1-O-acyltransferase PlsY [Candidatus Acidoferrales bacterium]
MNTFWASLPHRAAIVAFQTDPAGGNAGLWWLPILAYLLGSIPFGFLIVKMIGAGDIRFRGSGNIGATNVTREAGALPGLATLLLDGAKGYFAVWLAAHLTDNNPRWMIAAAVLALVGHTFPVWLKFQGGRGVATGAGVFLPISWQAVVGALIVWVVVLVFWRYVSLASISAAAVLPLLVYLLYAPRHAPPEAISAGASFAMLLIIARHRANIIRLLRGTEPRFSFRVRRRSPKL